MPRHGQLAETRTEHRLLGGRSAARDHRRDPRGRPARLRLGLDRRGIRVPLPDSACLAVLPAPPPAAWLRGPQTGRIRRGTAIVQMSARQPAATAMAAMTMDHLSGGRFILGLGVSGPQVVEGWYGMPFAKPLARTREYIGI